MNCGYALERLLAAIRVKRQYPFGLLPSGIMAMPRDAFYLAVTWALLLSFACILLFGSARYEHVDFVAFYCAGEGVAHGADPYREMPLNACEHRLASNDVYGSGATVPAPLPPYALLPFAALSRIVPEQAYLVFLIASLVALTSGCIILSRLTGASSLLVIAAVASGGWEDLGKGQPVPFVFLAIVGCGWALRRNRPNLAAIFASVTMIEPHIGLAVCGSLFLWWPKTRVILGLVATFLAVESCNAVSFPVAIEYLTRVLPLQATSEASWISQLSLTKILIAFHVPQHVALLIASAQYAITGIIGIVTARRLSIVCAAPEALAFLPPIFATIGGTYVHSSLLLVALPAAIFLTVRRPSALAYIALTMVAAYWLATNDPVERLITAASAGTIAYICGKRAGLAMLSSVALVFAIGVAYQTWQPLYGSPPAALSLPPTAFAQESWMRFVNAVNPPMQGQIAALTMKVPTWSGLLTFIGLSIGWARSYRSLEPDKARFPSLG